MLLLSYWKRTAQFVPRCRAKHSHPHRHTVAVRRQICIFKSKRYLSAFADILRHFQRSQFDNLIIIPLNRAFSFHISRLSSPAVTLQSHFSLRHPRVLVSICAMEWQEQSGTQAISCEHKMDNLILFFFCTIFHFVVEWRQNENAQNERCRFNHAIFSMRCDIVMATMTHGHRTKSYYCWQCWRMDNNKTNRQQQKMYRNRNKWKKHIGHILISFCLLFWHALARAMLACVRSDRISWMKSIFCVFCSSRVCVSSIEFKYIRFLTT